MAQTLGLGIVGYGVFGEISADQYATIPGLRIVAVADSDPQRQQVAAARFEAHGYPDLTTLLRDPAVDIVVLNTPPWLHGPQALDAARAGKHLFVEKPLATSVADGRAILRLCAESGLEVSVDYVMRHAPLYDTLRALTRSELLGKITYMALENHASNEALHAQHWFWDRTKSGGIFVEHGVHFFDLCHQLSGSSIPRVAAFAHTGPDGRQDRVLAALQYENGILATFFHGFDRRAIIERTSLRVTFERGSAIAYGWIPERLEIEGIMPPERIPEFRDLLETDVSNSDERAADGSGVVVRATLTRSDRTADYALGIRTGMADLVRAIREPGFTPQVTAENGFDSMALAIAAQESIDTGKVQSVARSDSNA